MSTFLHTVLAADALLVTGQFLCEKPRVNKEKCLNFEKEGE
jgi:hypothetical protein